MRTGKDFDGIAYNSFEREIERSKKEGTEERDPYLDWLLDLRDEVIKTPGFDVTSFNEIERNHKKEVRDFFLRKADFSKVISWAKSIHEEKPRMTGILDRETYLKSAEIIKAKEEGLFREERPRKEKKEKAPRKEYKEILIVEAKYGVPSIKLVEVTDTVKIGEPFTNKMAGGDPCPKIKKTLFIKALLDGVETEVEFLEGRKIIF